MLIFCMLVIAMVSLSTQAPDAEKIKGLIFGTATEQQRTETRQN
jgi:SSS family solute:Na+ symporter